MIFFQHKIIIASKAKLFYSANELIAISLPSLLQPELSSITPPSTSTYSVVHPFSQNPSALTELLSEFLCQVVKSCSLYFLQKLNFLPLASANSALLISFSHAGFRSQQNIVFLGRQLEQHNGTLSPFSVTQSLQKCSSNHFLFGPLLLPIPSYQLIEFAVYSHFQIICH